MLKSLQKPSKNNVGHGKLSSPSISAEDFRILRWVADVCRDGNPCRLFEVSSTTGEVRPVAGYPEGLGVEDLFRKLDALVERGLLSSTFDRKLLHCPQCGKTGLAPHTSCPSCGSEDIQRSAVFVHSCGASIPETALSRLTSCPKCKDALERSLFSVVEYRFLCNNCGNLFYDPRTMVECLFCGWADDVKNAGQLVLRKYSITGEARGLLESLDPVKQLVRKLIAGGFDVREKVKVMGLSGTAHVMDVVAVKRDRSETRLYTVFYRLTASDLMASTVKRLDIEKTAIEGAAGRVRWVVAGVEVEDAALRVAQTFGIEVERI
jgi:uncharacterized OB-fold protein